MSRHSGFVNLYSYCPKMILLIILHNDSADIIPRGVFVNEVHRKNEKCGAKSYKTGFLCIQKDITVNDRNRYYSTINFI